MRFGNIVDAVDAALERAFGPSAAQMERDIRADIRRGNLVKLLPAAIAARPRGERAK